jgi:predicted nuclease with TOPRIM domain
MKYWVQQAVQFNIQNYLELVNSMEMEIAELEEGKSFAKADEKKRLKQRYDDLIQNLMPLAPVAEMPTDTEGN